MEINKIKRNFLIFLVIFSLILVSFTLFNENIIIIGKIINENFLSNLLIPSAIMSLFLSFLGVLFSIFIIIEGRRKGITKVFPIRSVLISIFIILIILGLNYFVTLFPYGNLLFNVIIIILQIINYGFLIPYLIITVIVYTSIIITGKVEKIKW